MPADTIQPLTTLSTSYLSPSPTDGFSPWLETPHEGTNIIINITSNDGGSTGKGILIGMLSAFGSAAFVVLIFAIFYFFRHTSRGRIFLDRIGRPGEYDDEQALAREEAEALEGMDDLQRDEYLRAKAFIQANPPETMQTDISLSQFLAIQEKGVSAWEFEPELEIANCFVEARTEIEFFDAECSVQSNLPIPKQNEVYYWEAKIYDKPESATISIGVSTKPYPLFRLPGWHKSSIAYTSSGFRRYNQPFAATSYGPEYVQGDVIGVGYRPRTGTVFFTRNGKKLDDVAHGLKTQNFFPTVGANGPCTIHVNFGQSGFVFIEANVKKWGLAPITGSLAPPPPYGSEQDSILLEAGRDGSHGSHGNQSRTFATGYSRSRVGNTRLGPPGSPGPIRSPTEISLAQLAHIPSHEDIGEGNSRSVETLTGASSAPIGDQQRTEFGASDYSAPPPEYTSPDVSDRGSESSDRENHDERRALMQTMSPRPPVPSYDTATASNDISQDCIKLLLLSPVHCHFSGYVQRFTWVPVENEPKPGKEHPSAVGNNSLARGVQPGLASDKLFAARQSCADRTPPIAPTRLGFLVNPEAQKGSSMRGAEVDAANAGDTLSNPSAFHIIVLGAGGGPVEDHVTGLLVRSSATHWTKDSVLAIDAGVHLAAVIRILEEYPSNAKAKGVISGGPFANIELPHDSAEANGAYIVRELVSAYLITHPHLDHISGFAINTASFQSTVNPKRLAALPSTVNAIKDHIFNDIIWPNLSDENGGAGLVTFMRLEDNALNEGDRRGYIDICDGLSVNCWSVSHGRCMTTRRESRTTSTSVKAKQPYQINQAPGGDKSCAYDSAAFFLRDRQTGMEALIFGDVEPDSLSLRPRTAQVWSEAATKIVLGTLAGILIECSYDDSQCNELLFGHLCPRHLIVELQVLAEMVQSLEHNEEGAPQRKRTRRSNGVRKHEEHGRGTRRKRDLHSKETNADYSKPSAADHRVIPGPSGTTRPLEGLRVFIIHVKDNLRGGPHAGDMILAQLQEHEEAAQLGCVFGVSKSGTSIWL